MADNGAELGPLKTALEELRILNNLLDKICRVRETNHIMQIIISELVKATDADQGIINLVSPVGDDALQTVVRVKPDSGSLPYKVSSLISGWVLKNKKMLKIDDLDGDDRFRSLSSDDGKDKSIICHPMMVRNEIVGLTTLTRGADKGPFSDDQCRLVGILTSQSAQILSNAMLMEELARKNELLDLSRSRLKEENVRLHAKIKATFGFEQIVGKSPAMKNALSLASKFCANDAPVLITGETGTGKELIAKAIHYSSGRGEGPLVIKNCSVTTETLLESELFGHTRGSFTGATHDKEGLFKEAHGGTIFLDEIGDAPLSTQAAILRVIQTGEIRPVGSTKTDHVDVRVISATNRDLREEIENDKFREDLFYRLNTFLIELPPLRHRREDIPLLTDYFLARLKIKTGRQNLSVSPEAMDLLCRYSWPGNIRQLENEIERAAVVCDLDGIIRIRDFSSELKGFEDSSADSAKYRGKLRDLVEKIEKEVISSTLAEYEGNLLRTSKVLGLTRKGLKDKISRYGISTKGG